MEKSLTISFLFLLVFVCTIFAGDSDLKVYEFTISTPSPDDGATSYVSGVDTFTELSIIVINDGPDDLPTTSDGNYDFILSLENSNTDLQYEYTFTMEFSNADEDQKESSLNNLGTATYSPNATITVPTYECGNLTYICIAINVNTDADYSDTDSSNDYACLEFGDGASKAGILECTADLYPSNFTITDPTSNFVYPLGSDKTISIDILIDNIGWVAINETSDGSANFEFSAFISDSDDLDEVNATYIEFDVDTGSAYNLSAGIAATDKIWMYNLQTDINIPSEDCDIYQYVCMKVTAPSNADYTDGDTENNEVCIQFGDLEDGYAGNSPCSGCVIQVSLGLLLVTIISLPFMK
ncbi:uncharacterized protein [Ptychodera flava]|uniref:uncharacterized protein n=1 Tax=Ptychodera flava TaxID=63121 RepID=UPI00396A6C9F